MICYLFHNLDQVGKCVLNIHSNSEKKHSCL